ncbi:UPF0280 family protein [Ramlibacter sp. AW1]|uniref:UPF0280 family protein n=1 Tax=Ramlibacter aurantiacus TaxID=2801330 RepID=A0A936ZUY4_9BURK|nr:UPF0280 family protein [Ramlibacter aurantiacus]MBL0421620.1 UPF0280 family protein [Ramlibacter aurantiacus]
MQASRNSLPDGRWHLQHGPIDIVLGAEGEPGAVQAAHEAAWARFGGILPELVAELALLRQPVDATRMPRGAVARRMWQACLPFLPRFITPMAAVAGSVAEELVAFYQRPGMTRAWINNGGDVALHLAPGQVLRIGLFADLARFDPSQLVGGGLPIDGAFEVRADDPVRGVATSGWRGRSFSMGIADSVTVRAATASAADAAATLIANAVDAPHPRILRQPATSLKDDTDLGDRLVTVDVPLLPTQTVQDALASGIRCARELREAGIIHSAVLVCQGWVATDDTAPAPLLERQAPQGLAA